jgi:hypothetical protein
MVVKDDGDPVMVIRDSGYGGCGGCGGGGNRQRRQLEV